MKKLLTLVLLLLFLLSCTGPKDLWESQKDWSLHLIMDRVDYETVLDFEEDSSIEYDRLDLRDIRIPNSPLHQIEYNDTLVIHRFRNHFTPIFVAYYFDQRDSLLSLARLEWTGNKFGSSNVYGTGTGTGNHFGESSKAYISQQGNVRKNLSNDNSSDNFKLEYERIKTFLILHLEQPTSQDSKAVLVNISKYKEQYERTTIWDFKELYIVLSMEIKSYNSNIKLDYYWKETAAAILGEER